MLTGIIKHDGKATPASAWDLVGNLWLSSLGCTEACGDSSISVTRALGCDPDGVSGGLMLTKTASIAKNRWGNFKRVVKLIAPSILSLCMHAHMCVWVCVKVFKELLLLPSTNVDS